MTEQQLQDLLRKYREGLCTPQEKAAIEKWYQDQVEQSNWEFAPGTEEQIGSRLQNQLKARLGLESRPKPVIRIWQRVAAVAAIVMGIAIGSYLWQDTTHKQNSRAQDNKKALDIAAPASDRAMITLAGGEKIYIDSAGNGTIAKQGETNIQKLADGQITYSGSGTAGVYNTLFNPRGSKAVNITLSDGTKVWLNAESALRYPVAFSGKERKVEITGEAYFEVAHDASKPFIVTRANSLPSGEPVPLGREPGWAVQVLGTHFNVNAYDDEDAVRVTLLEGSVKVSDKGQFAIIKPGQQAVATTNHKLQTINSVDLEATVAWKNELFILKDADIKTVMKQMARWYDVEVEYQGAISEQFMVDMSRNTSLANVFKILEATGGVHFKIEGRKITVTP